MAIGGFFKALGKGARAVGRGAMKGVLGFDDRDITSKFGKKSTPMSGMDFDANEPDEDEGVSKYSGYSRGVADLGSNDPIKGDGFEAAEFGEAPPEVGMTGMESLIGLEMPTLPGFKRKGGMAKPGGVKIEAPKTMPTAYETVTAGQTSNQPIGMGAPGAGAIMDTEDSFTGKLGRMLTGGGQDAQQRMESEKADPHGVNQMKMPGYMALMTGVRGAAGPVKSIPGLTRGASTGGVPAVRGSGGAPARSEVIDINATQGSRGSMLGGGGQGQIGSEGLPGFEMRGGAGPTPYGRAMSDLEQRALPGASKRLTGATRPMPGPGGVEGPMPPLPPGLRETSMEVLYSPLTKSLKRVAR